MIVVTTNLLTASSGTWKFLMLLTHAVGSFSGGFCYKTGNLSSAEIQLLPLSWMRVNGKKMTIAQQLCDAGEHCRSTGGLGHH